MNIVAVVEGDGEVNAFPLLLRRLNEWLSPTTVTHIPKPIRVKRDKFLNKDDEFNRFLELAALKCGDAGWIIMLLDADDACPRELGKNLLAKARARIPHRKISVVLANKEYEAWFIAAAPSLSGLRGLDVVATDIPADVEAIRGAKEWISRQMGSEKYREIIHQASFSATIDLSMARQNSRSFRKLCNEWEKNIPSH